MRTAAALFFILCVTGNRAWSQATGIADEASKGRHLAIMLCATCHVVAPDQPYAPTTLDPPAPSFQSIAQRAGTTADSLRRFLTTSHNRSGMPDPYLAAFQIREISAYLLSLRRRPAPANYRSTFDTGR